MNAVCYSIFVLSFSCLRWNIFNTEEDRTRSAKHVRETFTEYTYNGIQIEQNFNNNGNHYCEFKMEYVNTPLYIYNINSR